jgi:DNA polymerase V
MGDIAECSVENEEILYKIFGVNAELLIDHAWGWEPCTIADIKAYKPESRSLSSGQVLTCPYSFEKGRLIVREMADLLALQLVEKRLVADQIVLTVGYDTAGIPQDFSGEFTADRYGRKMPKSAHGSANLGRQTSSARLIMQAVTDIYERIVNRSLMVRRMYVVANNVVPENSVTSDNFVQLDLFTDFEAAEKQREQEEAALEKEHNVQQAVLEIKRKYGKNAVLKGMNLEEGATTVERNGQVGGHKA